MAQQSMCDIIPHGMEVSPTRPWNGRASTKCLAFQLNKSGIRTGSLRTKLSVARKRNFQSRDKGAETASKGQGRPNSPLPGSGIFKAETKGPKRFRRWVLRLFTETTKPRPARTASGAPRPALKCLHVDRPETANVGRFARRCESVDMPRFDAFEPGLFEPKSPLRGNGIFRAETKRPKRPWRFKNAGAETNLARQPTRRGGRVRDRHRLLSC
jgi:hypothetical protein